MIHGPFKIWSYSDVLQFSDLPVPSASHALQQCPQRNSFGPCCIGCARLGSTPGLSYGGLGILPGGPQTEKLNTSEKQKTRQKDWKGPGTPLTISLSWLECPHKILGTLKYISLSLSRRCADCQARRRKTGGSPEGGISRFARVGFPDLGLQVGAHESPQAAGDTHRRSVGALHRG